MGSADRFGNPVAPAAGKDDRHSPRETDPVALRNEEGLYPLPRPEDGADLPVLIDQFRPLSALFTHRFMKTDKARFGAADRRQIEEQSQMRGKTYPSRMGDSLTIKEDDIGRFSELVEGRDQRRPFPEGQKSRDVREGDTCRNSGFFKKSKLRIFHQNDCTKETVAPPVIGDIGSGNTPDGIKEPVVPPIVAPIIAKDQLSPQFFLNGGSLPVRHVPAVQLFLLHCRTP